MPGIWRALLAGVLVACLAAAPAGADYSAGAAAFQSGDYAAAAAAWQPLAEAGETRAQFGLGVIYERGGGGVARDFARAAAWYREAAEHCAADAQFNLGNLFRLGHGVPRNSHQAVVWYLKAATQGMMAAQYNLALSYETGSGTPRNDAVAAKWYRLAAEQGDPRARRNLESLEDQMASRISVVGSATPAAVAPDSPVPDSSVPDSSVPDSSVIEPAVAVEPATEVRSVSRFGVQLAAYHQRDGAAAAWNALRATHPDLLEGLEASYLRIELAAGGVVFRLVAGGFETEAAAQELCGRLKQRDVDCLVPRP